MRVLVTGSTGFIGHQVVTQLLGKGHSVVATARSFDKAASFSWYRDVTFITYDLRSPTARLPTAFYNVDAVVHLSWQGLPNYHALFHLEENLPDQYRFIKALIERGVKHVLVSGTCLEYGMRNGLLDEEMLADPVNAYALAKDTLRKFLQNLKKIFPFRLQWLRLFYVYGRGQNSSSLLSQLDYALDNGHKFFNMSNGEQLRDYLTVEDVAKKMVVILEHADFSGIINCCSGQPISVRCFVEKRIFERAANIQLNLGYYPYPDYEPLAFWGSTARFDKLSKD